MKEIKFRPSTGEHDLRIKAKRSAAFLKDHCKVKVTINFKGREKAHNNIAYRRADEFLGFVNEYLDGMTAVFTTKPSMDRRAMSVMMVSGAEVQMEIAS